MVCHGAVLGSLCLLTRSECGAMGDDEVVRQGPPGCGLRRAMARRRLASLITSGCSGSGNFSVQKQVVRSRNVWTRSGSGGQTVTIHGRGSKQQQVVLVAASSTCVA
jgi:hypothetical protein